jgi:hypothetical protein
MNQTIEEKSLPSEIESEAEKIGETLEMKNEAGVDIEATKSVVFPALSLSRRGTRVVVGKFKWKRH